MSCTDSEQLLVVQRMLHFKQTITSVEQNMPLSSQRVMTTVSPHLLTRMIVDFEQLLATIESMRAVTFVSPL